MYTINYSSATTYLSHCPACVMSTMALLLITKSKVLVEPFDSGFECTLLSGFDFRIVLSIGQ